MKYLEPKSLEDKTQFMQNPAGNGSIARFSSKNFGGTFSRVIKLEVAITDVTLNPITGNPRALIKTSRIKNTIIYGRFCNYPNSGFEYWTSLQEQEPMIGSSSTEGRKPYVAYRYDGYYLEFVNPQNSPSPQTKIVIQLLFVEL